MQPIPEEKEEKTTTTTLKTISYDLVKPSINIVVIGEVSCGKSTLLNAIFVEKYGNVSKRRSTMSINIYQQNLGKQNTNLGANSINQILKEHETKFIKNNDEQLKELKEYIFLVPATDRFGGYDSKKARYGLNFIDVPGFNDRVSNQLLLEWLKNNVYLFDVIFFIIDGERALNTESEVKLLDAVLDYIVQYKNMKLFIIFNKFDSAFDEELQELCDQARAVVCHHCKDRKIAENQYHFLPFAAEFAYIYRHLFYKGTCAGLEKKQQVKLGVEEFGKAAKNMAVHELDAQLLFNLDRTKYHLYEDQMHGFKDLNRLFAHDVVDQIEQCFGEKILRLLNYAIDNAKSTEQIAELLLYASNVYKLCGARICAFVSPQFRVVCEKYLVTINPLTFLQFVQNFADNPSTFAFIEKYCIVEVKAVFDKKMMESIKSVGAIKFFEQVSPVITDRRVYQYIKAALHHQICEIAANKAAVETLGKPPFRVEKMVDFLKVMLHFGEINSECDQVMALLVAKCGANGSNIDKICETAQFVYAKIGQRFSTNTVRALITLMEHHKTAVTLSQLDQIGGVLKHYCEYATLCMNDFILAKIENGNDLEQYDTFLMVQNLIKDGRILVSSNYELYKMQFFTLPLNRAKCTYQWGQYQKYPNICSCLTPSKFSKCG